MQKVNLWLIGTIVAAVFVGAALLNVLGSLTAAPEVVVVKDHWRNHDGHWSFWCASDKHW
jgi:hypothetical protein